MIKIIRTKFVDISKVLGLVDPARSAEFKAKNGKAAAEHQKEHDVHVEGHGCCGTVNVYHIPED